MRAREKQPRRVLAGKNCYHISAIERAHRMREAELERRLAFRFLIVEQPVEYSQQIIIATCMKGGSANLPDMPGEGTWRIWCSFSQLEQGPMTSHIAFSSTGRKSPSSK